MALQVVAAMDAGYVHADHLSNTEFVKDAYSRLNVAFADLSADQQATLKGKQIGDAIRDIKVARVEDLF